MIVTFTPSPAIDLSTAVPRLQPTHKLRCSYVQRDPGGGGINVARVATRLGADAVAVYPRGGATGAMLDRLLADEAVAIRPVAAEEDTRENFYVSELETGQQFKFILPAPLLPAALERKCVDTLMMTGRDAAYLVCSGSVPGPSSSDLYARVASAAAKGRSRLVLDCSGRALAAALEVGVHLVKPSLRELEELVGYRLPGEAAWLSASRRIVTSRQAEIVALTLGDQGALLVTGDGAWRARPAAVAATGSVGAGDSFLAGLLVALSHGDRPADALRQAVAAGSAALLGTGTQLCRPGDAARLAASVEVRDVTPECSGAA
jgi:6-phosphofructokinase 2